MDREDLTRKIVAAKKKKGLTFREVAAEAGLSPAFVTAALLGQQALPKEAADRVANLLDLPEAAELLAEVPYRGSFPTAVPTDPVVYRFYEIVLVYGTTLKALIEEEFGDGIMSAIDFEMAIERVPDPKGDRVKLTLNGKFLPYRKS